MDAHEHTKHRASHKDTWAHKLTIWMLNHKKTTAIIAGAVLVCAASLVAFAIFYREPVPSIDVPLTHQVKQKPTPKYYSPLTGLELPDEAATKGNITAIMIENSPDARPQSGLKDADVVYEAIAEGGITRFVALYQQNRPELIGPVRSLRMYYLNWAAPYDPAVAHVGGSLYALREIRNGSHKDLDQFFNAATYWRASDRYAPHNVYTSFARLDALNAQRGYNQSNPQPIARQDTMPAGAAANTASVSMSGPTYNSSWQYDAASNTYLRSQAGAPHLDREKGQIGANVIVILKMQMNSVMEDGIREDYQTTGTGDAVVISGGKATEVTWHKENLRTQFSFTNKQDGKEFPLPRGKVWFSAIPINQRGGVSWQ
jgi:Protein of unknown function (DUF3048) N-terminal domain/Protein of unknown function (DUF3048) C-terminal domain